MKTCATVAGVLAAAVALALPPVSAANAADLYGESYTDQPYDDGAYEYRDEAAPGSVKDGYPVPMPPSGYERAPPRVDRVERFEPVERYDRRAEQYACLDRWQVRRQLRDEGWVDLDPIGAGGPSSFVRIKARRAESGRIFVLRVDRCSGEVVAARPHYLRSFGSHHHHHDHRWARYRD